MARFLKPLLSAVALAAAALTSTGALAAYNYNTQITITAPKGSTAELTAKDKTKPSGVKLSTCAAKITSVTPNIPNTDALSFTIKYDAGKASEELGDVYVLFENLNGPITGAVTDRIINVGRASGLLAGAGGLILEPFPDAAALHASTTAPTPFTAATDNLGTGAQTETLFGGSLGLNGLAKGLWALHVVIAKPGTAFTDGGANTLTNSSFSFGHPETWAASDTAVFALGSPIALDTVGTAAATGASNIVEYSAAAATDNAFCE